jgi:uncharacterized membrane protein
MISRLLYLALCTLVLAGITHICIILLIPAFGTRDAFAVLSRQTEPLQFVTLDVDAPDTPLSDVDPFFAYGVCRFSLSDSGVILNGEKIDTFWSATIVDGDGTVVYSLNSRTAVDQKLELILLNPIQILRLRELKPPEVEGAIVVESDMAGGFIVLRVLQPDSSWDLKAREFLSSVQCNAYLPTSPVQGNETSGTGS